MHAVVNHLRFTDPIDPALFQRAQDDLGPQMRAVPGFERLQIIGLSDTEVMLVIVADSPATLDRLATEVGSPWMRDHVVPLLAGPPDRKICTVLASA